MAHQGTVEVPIRVAAENVGGIDRTDVALDPGVNVLTGRNATNRTSFLQAIMAALGSERASLKGDAEAGSATLEYGGERYVRRFERRDGSVVFHGDPYLDDPELADLFAFLLESNEARRAVDRGDDLRELIMRPIDTQEIQAEIERLEAEKRSVEDSLESLDRLESELPALEERRGSTEAEIEAVEADLATIREEIESLDVDVEESRNRRERLEETFTALRRVRSDLEDVEYELETERASRRELVRERDDLADERNRLEDEANASADRVEGRIRELRERKRSLERTLSELQNVIRFNEERLEADAPSLEDALDGDDGETVTDELVDGDGEIVCWTCGSEVDRERIESTLEHLQSLHRDELEERNEIEHEIGELTERQREIRERERRREHAERRLEEVEEELDGHDDRIAELEAERERVADRVQSLEAETESFDDTDYSDVLERHREANELELQLEQLQADRDEVVDRIEEIESRLAERESLEERRASVAEELTERRTRVERVEAEAVEAFNEHMDSIRSILAYENVDRIWIERRDVAEGSGRSGESRRAFDLHVVRSTDDDRAYEDTIDHLSESEREVTGLVFALAGYLVHDVYEELPFVLLDSLEAMDADRIASLVAYFRDYADCLVVALLPEDANALPDAYNYVTDV